jgi:hypothetical protein
MQNENVSIILANALRQIADVLSASPAAPIEQPAMQEPRALCVEKYAKSRGFSVSTVRRWIKIGCPHVLTGRGARIIVAQADAWLAAGGARAAVERDIDGG